MNLISKYYANILGLIRFLDIGVGNEDARASSVFTLTVSALFGILLKLIDFDIRSLGIFFLVPCVLAIFFITYYFFSKKGNKVKVENWLSNSSRKDKLTTGLISLIFFITLLITLFRLYG